MSKIDLKELYNLVLNTVELATTPSFGSTDEEIAERLSELDGDSHTFFYNDNLVKLLNGGLLNESIVDKISSLREKIKSIPAVFWNVNHFQQNNLWGEVKNLADDVKKKLRAGASVPLVPRR